MPAITRFEEIEAWKTARELTKMIYSFTDEGKFTRNFTLRDRIRRAAVSVMSSIAEGFESQTQAQFIRYLSNAKASASEVRSQLYVTRFFYYLSNKQFSSAFPLAEKASHQIARFSAYLQENPKSRRLREGKAEYEV